MIDRFNKHLILTTVLLLASAASPLAAATLAEALHAALERHPDAARLAAEQRVGRAYDRQGRSLFGGDLAVDLSVTSDRYGSDVGAAEYVAGVSAPIWWPGQRSAKRAIGEAVSQWAEQERQRLRWEVAQAVLERGWAWRIARADAEQTALQRDGARALLRDVEHRYEVGELSRNDLLLAQQDAIDAESVHEAALGAERQAAAAWRSLTGLEELATDLDAFEAVRDATLDGHPRLRAAQAQLELARARVDDARAQRRAPVSVGVFAKRDRGVRGDDYDESLGLALSLPVGLRSAAAPEIAEAEAAQARAWAALARLRRELDLSLSQADDALASAGRLLDLAREKHDRSQSRLRLAERAFELGEMDLYQLLLARRQFYQDQREWVLRQLEKDRAVARKNLALGVVPQ